MAGTDNVTTIIRVNSNRWMPMYEARYLDKYVNSMATSNTFEDAPKNDLPPTRR